MTFTSDRRPRRLHNGLQTLGRNQKSVLHNLAGDHGFDLTITLGDGVAYQRSRTNLPIAVLILSAPSSDIDDKLALISAILIELARIKPLTIARIP